VKKKNPFWANLFKKPNDVTGKITDLCLQTRLFKNVPTSTCRNLVENMPPRYCKKGEAIFNQGELGAGAVLIS